MMRHRDRQAATAGHRLDAPGAAGLAAAEAPLAEAQASQAPASQMPESEAPLFADVLCAVDGTRASLAAVSQAAQLGGPWTHLTLLAVTSTGSGAPFFRSAAISSLRVRRVIDRATRVAVDAGVDSTPEVDPGGPPSAVIVKRAEEHDLLAIGAPVRSALGGFGGGVAAVTLRSFMTPLLLARPAPAGEGTLDRVLIASDGSDSSDGLVRLAAKLLARRRSEAVLVHALGSESQSQRHRIAAQQELLAVACDGRVTAVTEPGDACEVLRNVARRERVTLAVLGSRRRSGVASALGSVSRRAVHVLPCSALVIPPERLQQLIA